MRFIRLLKVGGNRPSARLKSSEAKNETKVDDIRRYSNTVLLPKTEMPMKRKIQYEKELLKTAAFTKLYEFQSKRESQTYTLHDGPPYANGPLHFGHVINKTLKDIFNRYCIRHGFRIEYVPGWDCHGMPIEMKVLKSADEKVEDPCELRDQAQKFAREAITNQMSGFKRLGVVGDWSRPYLTLDREYVVKEIEVFERLSEKGLLYRDYYPIYWSPSSLSTLSEAELEYNEEHKGHSLYYKFKLVSSSEDFGLEPGNDVYALIWTTTPWTLPSNQAIAFSSTIEYCLVKSAQSRELLIVAKNSIERLKEALNDQIDVQCSIPREKLEIQTYLHPLKEAQTLPLLEGSHVKSETGTGLVHTAPNHGHDDFKLAMKMKMPVDPCLVDDHGLFKTGLHSHLDGKSVLDEGSIELMKILEPWIVKYSPYIHSYPYDWRTRKPVLIKPSQQWFFRIDSIRSECVKLLERVKFMPEGNRMQMINEILTRPPWCISRQRTWGVPIPCFYDSEDLSKVTPIFNRKTIDHLSKLITAFGPNCWWKMSERELIPENCGLNWKNLVKSGDIFDVWIDSGLSWLSVLGEQKSADLYLEGVDQCHGWFQSSLIMSVALRNRSPYEKIFIHGFAVDSEGKKMSKSLGNVVDPVPLIEEKYGADTVRWFIAAYGSGHGNVKVDEARLKASSEIVFKIRNTLRYLAGSLNNFDAKDAVEYDKMTTMDQYMLHIIHNYAKICEKHYQNYDLRDVAQESRQLVEEISAFYLAVVKDRLYCDAKNSYRRRSCQTALKAIVDVFSSYMSPILPFLFEEFNTFSPVSENTDCSQFLHQVNPIPDSWHRDDLESAFKLCRRLRKIVNNSTESTRHFGKKYNAHIYCSTENDLRHLELLHKLDNERGDYSALLETLQLSSVDFSLANSNDTNTVTDGERVEYDEERRLHIKINQCTNHFCPRCRRFTADKDGGICSRCSAAIGC